MAQAVKLFAMSGPTHNQTGTAYVGNIPVNIIEDHQYCVPPIHKL